MKHKTTNNSKKRTIGLMLAGIALSVHAQNPIISGQFTADPTARVFNGKVYLYPSHDIPAPEGQRQDWFCMADYHVFSSDDLINWHDHGVIIDQKDVPWGKHDGYSMWAPDCVYKNGKYYFFFPNTPKDGRGFNIGVAVANTPVGPFSCDAQPIKGLMGIDPCVLLDDDGSAYIYWGGMGLRGAKLKDNLTELDGEQKLMEGLPDGFKEGPFVFKNNGKYYLTFPWVREKDGTETLAYSMSDNPLGPWEFNGVIMKEHANGCWTNHHSIVNYKGQWYLFYHHNDYSPKFDKNRSVCIDRLFFNADGTIQEVAPTLRGVGINKATDRIQIDRYSSASDDVQTAYVDTTDYFLGMNAVLKNKGSWIKYEGVDFSSVCDGYVMVNVKAAENTEIAIREKSTDGKVIARVPIVVKSGQGMFKRDLSNQWLTLTVPLNYQPNGVTDLVVTCEDKPASIDWLQFKNRPKYFAPVQVQNISPDGEGFIRRWMMLEPIKQDVQSNIIFTDSYLDKAFNKTYFKGQMTALPKAGKSEKVGSQNLKWHALDSENFNVKLFRFAEKYGDQTYGSLFWAYTIIDCPKGMKNVRLAAGSNGASSWWLNGKQVLMLSGDRRMVEDDGMSARINLKPGRNILRVAVINGPGLSDMCVRFIDENGKPITNQYTITLK